MEDRVARLKAQIEAEWGGGPMGALYVAIVCNGCGLRLDAPSKEQLAPLLTGWRIGEWGGDDYCPSCLG
jgi:hypothetical protein